VGARGGIVRRSKNAESSVAADADIPNARAVLIDGSVPWDFAPQTEAEVFRFAAWDGGPSKSDWLLPSPGFLEALTDVPTAPTSSVETYAVAPALVKPPSEVMSIEQFLSVAEPTLIPVDKIIHSRCEELFRKHSGTLYGQEKTPVAKIASVQKLEEEFSKGAVWVDEPSPSGSMRCELKEWPAATPASRVESWTTEWPIAVLPPLATKLYIESNLREAPERRNV